jgi:PAS domain S-box-containing protein
MEYCSLSRIRNSVVGQEGGDEVEYARTDQKTNYAEIVYPKSDLNKIIHFMNSSESANKDEQLPIKDISTDQSYQNLFANNPMPMWVLSLPSLRFVDVNESAVGLYGYSREQFLSMTAFDIRSERDRERFESIDRSTPGTFNRGIWQHITKNGAVIDVEIFVHEITFAGEPARLVMVNNVTDRLKAEQAVIKSEARFRKIFESSLIGLFFWDQSGTITDANDLFFSMLGYEEHVIKSRGLSIQALIASDAALVDDLQDRLRESGFYKPVETTMLNRDGSPLHVLLAAATVSEELRVSYVLDISARLKLQAELLELNQTLEERVKVRTRELEFAKTELESFTYSVSHDLRTPLRAINGFSHILREEHSHLLDDESVRLLKIISANSQRMGQLVDDLLTFIKLGRTDIHHSKVQLDQVVADVISDLESMVLPGAKLRVHPLGVCIGDPVMLYKVFYHLISNALKYSSKVEVPLIEIGRDRKNDVDVFFVKDNGLGFDMSYYHTLFRIFNRLHADDEFEGTGIGLAIVNRIVSKHGGKVWGVGEPNRGATFYFTINT